MITIPYIATVADLQRKYRFLVERIKRTKEPMVIVSNGKPDVVVVDAESYNARVKRLKELEEEYILKIAQEGLEEYKKGKTITLAKNQKILDLI